MTGRPLTIIGGVVAVIALVAFIVLGARTTAGSAGVASANLKPVVVAARDISVRVPLTAADVKVTRMLAADIPPQSFDRIDQVKGLIPTVGISTGQSLTGNLLVTSSDQVSETAPAFLPIPKGFVAKTIPTGEQQGVAGYINPGDYISIIAIVNGGGRFANARTIYTNVHVVKVGLASTEIAPVPSRNAGPTPTPTPKAATTNSSLTVIVTQCQAEYLDWFLANATIKYTLESYKDYAPKDTAIDSTCPGVDSAGGVTLSAVAQRFPGILATQ